MAPQGPLFIANDQPLSSRDPHKQLIASLERLVTQQPPDAIPPGGGLYHGPTSIAFLFFALNNFYRDFSIMDIPMGTWYAAYLKQSQDAMAQYPGPTPASCGVADDILALVALSAASSRDPDMARELCDYVGVVVDEDGEDDAPQPDKVTRADEDPEGESPPPSNSSEPSNEWLYGRAGYLYLLRLVRASFAEDDPETTALLDDTADEVITRILEAPRPWRWHGQAYVGAVHGALGIITQIVLTDPRRAREVEPDLAVLLSYQLPSGNWPSSLPPSGRDLLVQFCHGAPGVVSSLLSVRQFFPALHDRIDEAVDRGRKTIKERGLLTKEPCLCHGTSGNALALADEHFEHFLTYTTNGEIKALDQDGMMVPSDDQGSLYTGEAGRAWAWAVADKRLEKRFLGYNDL